jgi:hypothetical protein
MSINTKINLSDNRVYQSSGQTLTLSGNTVVSNQGNLNYSIHPNFTENTQIVDKKYVDDSIVIATGISTIYDLASPATVTVGGISAGYVLTGKTSNCLLKEILTPYQAPSFSSFSVSTLSTPVEVGTVLSGSQIFTWSFSNNNISANTMCVIDVTDGNTVIANNISATSPQSATIATKTFTSCNETQQWKGCVKNSCGTSLGSSNSTITALLPYYWGLCTCPGAAGENRPSTLTPAQITGGSKVLASSGSFTIPFNSTANDYLWFAIPSASVKTCWCVDALNNGSIGGSVSPAGQLFPTPVSVGSVSNNCWNDKTYCVYISNKQTSQSSIIIS